MALSGWIELTTEGMQRLGHVKALVSISSPARLTNFQALNAELSRLVRAMVPIGAPTEAVQKYFGTRKKPRGKDGRVEIQDAFLSMTSMPSQTGSLTNKAFEDGHIVNLAVALGLLRAKNFSLTPLGRILQHIMGEKGAAAFKSYSPESNPYVLKPAEKVFFLYCFISSDGEVIKRLYPRLLEVEGEFNRAEAGNILADVFREMASDFKSKARSLEDFATIRKWHEYAHAIENQPLTSHSGVREQRVTLRLEAFVDLSLLQKDEPSKYSYRFGPTAKCFSQRLRDLGESETFLRESYFQFVNECWELGGTKAEDVDEIVTLAMPAYMRLKSDLGYAPLLEMLLLANINALGESPRRYFELGSGMQAVRVFQRDHPDDVRFNVDRRGEIRYVKFR
jgi:hypothetical protein